MNQISDPDIVDPRWKDLYQVGGICGILIPALTIFAIAIYFIWPYQPGLASTAKIFETIQTNKLNGLMSLDFVMVVITIINIPFFLALYVALRRVNESYALLALVFGLIACIIIIPARPIAEMFALSSQYVAATTDAARSQYLSAGEALSTLFNGTAWIVYMIAHSGEFVHRFRSCRPVAKGSNAGGRIINQVDGMGSWNAPFIGFFLLKKEDG